MTQKPLVVLAVDEDRGNQAAIAQAFNQQGVTYRFITDRRKFAGGLKQLDPGLIMVFGELNSDFAIQVLDTLNVDVTFSTRPVVVVCEDQSAQAFVKGFRSGVVALLPRPFTPEQVDQVKHLWAELPTRAGLVSGAGDGKALGSLIDHVRRSRRSGVLVISPRTPNEGRATFVNGKLERARFLGATGLEAVRAMAQLPAVQFTFAEVAGQQGEGAGVVIEVGDINTGETPVADVVVGSELGDVDEPLAFEMGPPKQEPAMQAPPISTASGTHRAQLLMVDDDEAILRMFGTLFAKHGFEVTTARDGEEGASIATQRNFDLVFADLNMPHLDGWGMLRVLRDDFRTRELPVAFISAHDDYRESLRALDAGAQAYVSKGTRLDAIVAQARKLLEPRHLVQAMLELGGALSLQIHTVGPQWLLHQLALHQSTGTLSARDGWATYTLVFEHGRCVHCSAVAGKYMAEGERAFNAFIATRAAEGEFGTDTVSRVPNLFLGTDVMVERACSTLNENERRMRESLMVQATQIEVNEALYDIYRQVGPTQWLECARLICEEKLAPREIISRLDLSPVDIEETMKDLLRRGVVNLQKA
jgi:DNA-binding response OmpR family regulator